MFNFIDIYIFILTSGYVGRLGTPVHFFARGSIMLLSDNKVSK